MLGYLLVCGIAAVLAFVVTPWIRSAARRSGVVKKPRGQGSNPITLPSLGGLAVIASFLGSLAIHLVLNPASFDALRVSLGDWRWLLAGVLLVLVLGVTDDLWDLRPMTKIGFQVIAALLIAGGNRISKVRAPVTEKSVALGWLSFPVTLLWVVGITNAFNLIDGLDGLAAGVALIASATLWALTRARPRADVSLLAASLVGALAGFLRYNFYPASILLGDSGSMSIGYLLSVLYVAGSREESGEVSILIPFLALGLPITDTLLAVTRRLLKAPSELGGDCERPESHLIFARLVAVFRPDQEHLHHRLLRIGLKHHHAVLLLYFVSTALGLSAFLAANVKPGIGASVIGGAGILAYAALRRLGYLGGRIPVRRLPRRG